MASMNESGSNGCTSSTRSPTPTSLTGTERESRIAIAMPPRAVPSSLARKSPVTRTASPKTRACSSAFCPLVASSTRRTSCGAPGIFRSMTSRIFTSCRMRPASTCSRPAVSTRRTSAPRPRTASTASNTTAAGSAPSAPRTRSTPRRSAQMASCSTAPARKVSAAARTTERPSARSVCAIFATLVVLPTPFTPTTSTTVGGWAAVAISGTSSSQRRFSSAFRKSIASSPRSSSPLLTEARSRSTISVAARTPTSAAMSRASISSTSSSSSRRPARSERSPPPRAPAVRARPCRTAAIVRLNSLIRRLPREARAGRDPPRFAS